MAFALQVTVAAFLSADALADRRPDAVTSSPARKIDEALRPVKIDLDPGPAYESRRRMFQGIPGIARSRGGRLWATWYAGDKGEGPYNYVVLVTSGDGGHTWSSPKLVVDPPGIVRAFDPCLWLDPNGALWLFWAQGAGHFDGRSGVWAISTSNPDAESPSWSPSRRLADGVMMNKPTVLSNGDWLLPAAVWSTIPHDMDAINKKYYLSLSPAEIESWTHDQRDSGGSHLLITSDQGKSFQLIRGPRIPESHFDEHMVVERKDKSWWLLTRTKYGIGESVSSDCGKSWSPGRDTGIPHANSRFFIRRLKSGNLLLVRHNSPEGMARSHLTAQISTDDGRSWQGGLLLDERIAVSYPDGVEDETGRIILIYDRERTKTREILFATFTEDDILRERCISSACALKQIIDRAGPANSTDGESR